MTDHYDASVIKLPNDHPSAKPLPKALQGVCLRATKKSIFG